MSYIKYPGIRRIWRLSAADLPQVMRFRSLRAVRCFMPAPIADVSFYGDAILSTTSKQTKGGLELSTKITFNSTEYIFPDQDEAWAVELVDGKRYLIGSLESPRCFVSVNSNTSSPGSAPRGVSYEVEWAGTPVEVLEI